MTLLYHIRSHRLPTPQLPRPSLTWWLVTTKLNLVVGRDGGPGRWIMVPTFASKGFLLQEPFLGSLIQCSVACV